MSRSEYELEEQDSIATSLPKFGSNRPQSYSFSTISKGGISHISQSSNSKSIEGASQRVSAVDKQQNGFITFYRSLSWMFGFKEKYSLILFFICGGGLLGYCLARAYLMNQRIMVQQTVPGEFRWFSLPLYKTNYIIHIYLSIVAGFLVGLQFLPNIRQKSILLHRVNGYTCITLLIIGNVCGAIISRRVFGGEINAQSAYYTLAIMLIFAAIMGFRAVKRDTRAHRKWMLRSVVYFSVIITAKLIMLAARTIITDIGTYYSLWRCDEVFYVLKNETHLTDLFPQCNSSTPSDNGFHVVVHASVHEGPLGTASAVRVVQGMTLWIATLIHVVLVEVYIRSTDSANYHRRGFALEPRNSDTDKSFSPQNWYW